MNVTLEFWAPFLLDKNITTFSRLKLIFNGVLQSKLQLSVQTETPKYYVAKEKDLPYQAYLESSHIFSYVIIPLSSSIQ